MPIVDGKLACRCAHHAHHAGQDGFSSGETPKHYPPDLGLEPVHNAIDLSVDIDAKEAAGTVTVTVEARRDGVRSIELAAVDFRDVEVVDADGHEISNSYDGQTLSLVWGEPFARGESRRAAISYRVVEPTSGLFFSKPDDAYPYAGYWAATDHETERARHWLPCVDHPTVRTRLDFRLKAREDLTILANGTLVEETINGDGTKTACWRLDYRCPSYLTCFAIGEFTEAGDGEFEGRPIAYFAEAQHPAERLMRSFGRTGEMLGWMTEKLGAEFPFEKYYQFALPDIGGAMENISLVSWDDVFVLDETLALEWGWLVDQINVHEMAHSYFGDAIVCRDFSQVWLKESWATYMEQCWLEDSKGADERDYDFYRNSAAYFEEADGKYKRPIVTRRFDSSWDMFDRHLYPGGAARLHTLRNLLGDEVFWRGVRAYVARYMGQVVETEDFRRSLEEESGRSLVRFFEQWFYRPGYPDLKVDFSWDAEEKRGTFTVEQKQAAGGDEEEEKEKQGADDERQAPVFEIPNLKLGWTIDGEAESRTVCLERAKQSFVVEMAAEPQMVRVDPDGEVLLKLEFNPGDEMLRRQLTRAPDVIGRIRAAHELAKTAKKANVEAIAAAYDAEPFWGVRQQFAKALRASNTEAGLRALIEVIGREEDPMVLEAIFREAAHFQDAQVAEAVQVRLSGELPYRARQAALEALGAQRDQAPFEQLVEASEGESYQGIVEWGAVRALAGTRKAEAIDPLLERAAHGGAKHRVRVFAVGALGTLAPYMEKRDRERIVEALIGLLRDPYDRVRWAAAHALAEMGATEALPALEAYRLGQAHQFQVQLERTYESLRKGEDVPKVKALEGQLEELRKKQRLLEERLEKLEAKS